MWDRVVIPLGVQCSLNNIFGALMLGGLKKADATDVALAEKKAPVAKICFKYFISDFPFNIFHNKYAIFYEMFITLQVKVFTEEQLRSVLDNNRDLILNSPYIDKSKYAKTTDGNIASDDDIVSAVTNDAVDSMNELSRIVISEDEFKSSCTTYIDWYKNAFAEFTALNMTAIMSDAGFDDKMPGKRAVHYHGLKDMTKYYNSNMRVIKALSEENKIKSKVLGIDWVKEQMENDNKKDMNVMFPIGLRKIDEKIGDLRRGHMIGVMGPTKGGKTKFSNYLVTRALLHGYNVCVWPLEGSIGEWESMQISSYLAQVAYAKVLNSGGSDDSIISIASDDILNRRFIGDITTRKQINSARLALATDESMGRLSFIKGTAYVEDMFEELMSHYENENPYDVLVIDSLVNVNSRYNKNRVETIAEAYMKTKNFIENELKQPALAIVPAQLKQTTIDFLRKNPDETIDITAGAESAETIRTPDTTIGLFSTKQERDNHIMKFYCVASRHTAAFEDFEAKCRLESCLFYDGE